MDIERIRQQFPVFSIPTLKDSVFFDGAAGTQMCKSALDASVRSAIEHNANLGGHFSTSTLARQEIDRARCAAAALVNANCAEEIVFGHNMTTLTFHLSRCLGRSLRKGDEIVLTRSDHEANISPWLELAKDLELSVRWLPFDSQTYGFDISEIESSITERTKIVALSYANNITGTINDVALVAALARRKGAIVYIDAVQFAPHGVIDVQALGCDFLVCSSHKLYGPHHGILWGRLEVLEALIPYKPRPTSDSPPYKLETGTKSREAIAGILGAIDHLAWIGREFGGASEQSDKRQQIVAGTRTVVEHEQGLVQQVLDGLKGFEGIRIYGYCEPSELSRRVPTLSFTLESTPSEVVSQHMAEQGIRLWHGNNFSTETIGALGLDQNDGVVRISLAQYSSQDDVQRFLSALDRFSCPASHRPHRR
ncbi:cysteine desulfurase-like protein [Pseudomonas sp. NPDC089530]|uniref:cysteine desulfurase-like protein n=1 Tax=Pseudomonas sp. NPDC089530 TaxID=3390651 RepID=UPI003D01DB23